MCSVVAVVAAILVKSSVRDWTRTSSDSKISAFIRPHVIGIVEDLFFSTLESGFKYVRIRCRIHRMSVGGSRIWKEKVADLKISGYVWTGPQGCGNYIIT